MCPPIAPPPRLQASLVSASAVPGWAVLAFGLATGLVVVLYAKSSRVPANARPVTIAREGLLLIGVALGVFLVVGVADPWGSSLLTWYNHGLDLLISHSCASQGIVTQYNHLHHIEDLIRTLGVATVVGVVIAPVILARLRRSV